MALIWVPKGLNNQTGTPKPQQKTGGRIKGHVLKCLPLIIFILGLQFLVSPILAHSYGKHIILWVHVSTASSNDSFERIGLFGGLPPKSSKILMKPYSGQPLGTTPILMGFSSHPGTWACPDCSRIGEPSSEVTQLFGAFPPKNNVSTPTKTTWNCVFRSCWGMLGVL